MVYQADLTDYIDELSDEDAYNLILKILESKPSYTYHIGPLTDKSTAIDMLYHIKQVVNQQGDTEIY